MTAGFDFKVKIPYAGVKNYRNERYSTSLFKFPFIFCGKNFAAKANGATGVYHDYGQLAELVPGSSVDNMLDGSKSTKMEIQKSSGRWFNETTDTNTSNYGKIRLDFSESMSGDDEINIVCVEMDKIYPIGELGVYSYTDSGYSADQIIHSINQEYWLGALHPLGYTWYYQYGVQPKIDSHPLGTFDDNYRLSGLDGKYVFFMLQKPITSDRPYVEFYIRETGRSKYGYNGDFKLGRWGSIIDEHFIDSAYSTGDVLQDIKINAAGSGYNVDDILTFVGGTPLDTAAQLKVLTVGGSGEVLTFDVETYSIYSATPSNPVSVTGGAGSSATFNLTWLSITPNPDHATESPVEGNSNNHIILSGCEGVLQQSATIEFLIRNDFEYILQFYHKTVISISDPSFQTYRIKITYYDWENSSLGTEYLILDLGFFSNLCVYGPTPGAESDPVTRWVRSHVYINRKKGGRRESGCTTRSSNVVVHEVPNGTKSVRVWFSINSDPTWVSAYKPIWQIDDVSLSSVNNLAPPGSISQIRSTGLYGTATSDYHDYYEDFDFGGDVKITRLGMYQYNFSTSKQKRIPGSFHDLGGLVGANFSGLSYSTRGKLQQRNFAGRIIGEFISKAGTKQSKRVNIVATKEMKEAIEEFYNGQKAFGLVEPQGEFSDYIIGEGTLNWKAIDPINPSDPANYLWEGTMVLEEV